MPSSEIGPDMRRREFITLVGGAAVWPRSVGAEWPERVRRVGMLVPLDDPDSRNIPTTCGPEPQTAVQRRLALRLGRYGVRRF